MAREWSETRRISWTRTTARRYMTLKVSWDRLRIRPHYNGHTYNSVAPVFPGVLPEGSIGSLAGEVWK